VGIHLIQAAEITEPKLDKQIERQTIVEMFEVWMTEKIEEISAQIKIDE
jgi:hypothetical protein